MAGMMTSLIELRNITKDYVTEAGETVHALKNITLTIAEGEFVAIMGRSGSGKSTFMNILGTLDRATQGDYLLAGTDIRTLANTTLNSLRNRTIGFVFQNYNLIPRRTIIDNVALPLAYAGVPIAKRREIAQSYLDLVGLKDHSNRKPNQLSGGQQQRAAIARALVTGPKIILADEPTGNLDSKTATSIMELLTSINQSYITIVLVTHELKTAAYARRVIHFKDGNILLEDERDD